MGKAMHLALRRVLVLFSLLMGGLVCLWPGVGNSAEPLSVFVSILPQKYFVDKIGGDLVHVSVMVPPGANPHLYEPRPGQMAALAKTRIYFAVGVTFEVAWLPRLAPINPSMKIVHTEEGIQKIPMESPHPEEQGEHPDGHGTKDPHVWLSPPEVKIQAKNILRALQEADPENKAVYERNFKAFEKEIDDIDGELKKIFAGKKGMKFMVFHPSWGYFARAYGLEQVPVELEGKEPNPGRLKALIELARKEGIKVIFVQPQFSTKGAEIVAKAIEGQVVIADPLSPDWSNSLREQAEKFKAALR
jgi:zinc transport system substrate-binding protein